MNSLNEDPDHIESLGVNILKLASFIGTEGVKIVASHHLVVKKAPVPHLLWSNLPYHLKEERLPNGEFDVDANLPIHKGDKLVLNTPTIKQIDECVWELLLEAVQAHWDDNSVFTPSQLRFLMRLSNLKLADPAPFKSDLNDILKALEDDRINPQKACIKLIQSVNAVHSDIIALYFQLVIDYGFHNPKHFIPYVTTKGAYLRGLKNANINKLQPLIQSIENEPIPDDTFITMNKRYGWNRLTVKDMSKLIKAVNYFLI